MHGANYQALGSEVCEDLRSEKACLVSAFSCRPLCCRGVFEPARGSHATAYRPAEEAGDPQWLRGARCRDG